MIQPSSMSSTLPARREYKSISLFAACAAFAPDYPAFPSAFELSRSSTVIWNTPVSFIFTTVVSLTYWLASADWMQRNFDRRVEIAFPVLDAQHQARLKEILEIQLSDSAKGWQVQPDGRSLKSRSETAPYLRSQERLYEIIQSANGISASTRATGID